MTKKRKQPTLEDVLSRPWCYYCERDFDDIKVLHNHQKAKHFKCAHCNKRMKTIGGLRVHLSQTHKVELDNVENAIPGRNRLDVEIFGTEGIPEDATIVHTQLITEKFYSQEVALRGHAVITSGQQPKAPVHTGASKKPKIETPEELKKRLAEHKAKRAAEKAAKSSGNTELTPALHSASPSDVTPQFHMAPSASPASLSINPQQSFSPLAQYHPSPTQPPFPYSSAGSQPMPAFSLGPPGPPQMAFPPPTLQHMPHQVPVTFPPHLGWEFPQPHGVPPSVSPYPSSTQFTKPVPAAVSPLPANGSPLHRSSGQHLPPPPPGLPQRPSFDAPPVSRSQLQDMHNGQAMSPGNGPQASSVLPPLPGLYAPPQVMQAPDNTNDISASVDVLIDEAQQARALQYIEKRSPRPAPVSVVVRDDPVFPALFAQTPQPEQESIASDSHVGTPREEKVAKATGKKAKKAARLVVTDHDIPPEEKMARLARYSFERAIGGPA